MVLSSYERPILSTPLPLEDCADALVVRSATMEDGSDIWRLVDRTGVLDVNSSYAYVLLCHHFNDTCLVAELGDRIVGFVTAYIPPHQDDTIFVWQIGVAGDMRKMGIAQQLLHHLIQTSSCQEVRYLETTISPSNKASQALFRGFARDLGVSCQIQDGFDADLFKFETHEPEHFYRIGPFRRFA